jgi:hypothetical protein
MAQIRTGEFRTYETYRRMSGYSCKSMLDFYIGRMLKEIRSRLYFIVLRIVMTPGNTEETLIR